MKICAPASAKDSRDDESPAAAMPINRAFSSLIIQEWALNLTPYPALRRVRMKVFRVALWVFGLWLSGALLPAFGDARLVNVYGWGDDIDPKVIEDFTKETGITVTYETYNSDKTLEARLQAGRTGFDVVIVSGRVLQGQIAAGLYLRTSTKASWQTARHFGRRSWRVSRSMIRATNMRSTICGLRRALPTMSKRPRNSSATHQPILRSRPRPILFPPPCSTLGTSYSSSENLKKFSELRRRCPR